MLKPWLLFGSLLAAGAALAIGTGSTQPQTPQSPLEDRTPAASPSPSQPDAAVQEMPQRERTDEPSPSDPHERERDWQDGVPIEPEAQRDR